MTLIAWKPFIRVIHDKLHQEMFHQWFLFITSEICHVGPYCDSRRVLAWTVVHPIYYRLIIWLITRLSL